MLPFIGTGKALLSKACITSLSYLRQWLVVVPDGDRTGKLAIRHDIGANLCRAASASSALLVASEFNTRVGWCEMVSAMRAINDRSCPTQAPSSSAASPPDVLSRPIHRVNQRYSRSAASSD